MTATAIDRATPCLIAFLEGFSSTDASRSILRMAPLDGLTASFPANHQNVAKTWDDSSGAAAVPLTYRMDSDMRLGEVPA
jgi:hypothetical protein